LAGVSTRPAPRPASPVCARTAAPRMVLVGLMLARHLAYRRHFTIRHRPHGSFFWRLHFVRTARKPGGWLWHGTRTGFHGRLKSYRHRPFLGAYGRGAKG